MGIHLLDWNIEAIFIVTQQALAINQFFGRFAGVLLQPKGVCSLLGQISPPGPLSATERGRKALPRCGGGLGGDLPTLSTGVSLKI
jgi:hypothetical protein